MLFAEVIGKIAAVSVIVMEGFEGSLSESVIWDTGDCV